MKKMAIRNIRIDGDDILRKKCKPVEKMTDRISTLIDDMFDTMYEANGVGLAAPQVTYCMQELKAAGFDVSTDITTLEEAKKEILKALGK